MTLRERILVGLAAAAVVGAGIYVLLPKAEDLPVSAAGDVDHVVAVMETQLQNLDLSEHDERILELLEAPLPTGSLKAPPEEEEAGPGPEILPRYSGYARIGERMLALLDGREYFRGETLRGRQLILREIHPGEVILNHKVSGEQVHIELEQEQR